jgi:precorrin-6B methylase 2
MSTSHLEQLFSFLQHLIFQQIGGKIRTNFLKNSMDSAFILFERIGSKFQIISEIYLKMYQEILTKEISLAQISQHDRVLVIGSGSLPVTPTLIVRNTQAKTIAIDKDPVAVKDATHYVLSQNLERNLKIEYADGLTYPVGQFSVIFVLYGVKHSAEILRHLANHINQGTRVIYRTITDVQGKILDQTLDLSQYFIIKKQIRTEGIGTIDSFLLLKK